MILAFVIGAMVGTPPLMAAKRRDHHDEPKTAVIPKPALVERVDPANWTIQISTGQKERNVLTYTVTKFTQVFVNGKPAKLEEVQKGMRVSVVSSDGKTATRVDAATYQAPEGGNTDKKQGAAKKKK